jgi:hypothetical protein
VICYHSTFFNLKIINKITNIYINILLTSKVIEGFENVNIYPIIAHVLGLEFDENKIDGKLNVLKPILKK